MAALQGSNVGIREGSKYGLLKGKAFITPLAEMKRNQKKETGFLPVFLGRLLEAFSQSHDL